MTIQYPLANTGFALAMKEDQELPSSSRIELQTHQISALKPGEVLIKVLASPVNPSDLVYLLGKYGLPPENGKFVGFEASGIVVDANAGFYGKYLKGKRVAFSATPGLDGVWSQYAVTKANFCLPVRKELTDEQAATLIVNPCTSVCLVDRAKGLGAKAIVLNAAASQVGKGVIRYANMLGIKTIATVRSEANVSVLKQVGATEVLLTTATDYRKTLKDACHQHKATVLLDAVADKDTPEVMSCMPNGATAIVYGRLTETHDPVGGQFAVADLIFRRAKVEGFWLATYIAKASPLSVLRLSKRYKNCLQMAFFKLMLKQM